MHNAASAALASLTGCFDWADRAPIQKRCNLLAFQKGAAFVGQVVTSVSVDADNAESTQQHPWRVGQTFELSA